VSGACASRVSGTWGTASAGVLLRAGGRVMRSWPEKAARANETDGTARFETFGDATETVLSVIPSGKRASSDPLQPDFWKSLIRTASRRVTCARDRMLSASLTAGP